MDFYILDLIKKIFECPFMDFIIPKITFLGNGGFIWVLTAIILLFFKKYRKGGIAILIALAFGAILGSFVLKPLIARPRPFHSMEELSLLIKSPTGFSFPSGHTMSSFSAAYILNYINKKFGYFAIPLAILIAFSRLYLYVHFPSDILAGAILGTLISYLTVKVLKINR